MRVVDSLKHSLVLFQTKFSKPTALSPLRSDDYYAENHIKILMNTRVTGVDVGRRRISLENGDQMPYTKLVLALGGAPRKLPMPGGDLNNVYTLRVASEASAIAAASEGKHVVCIGASFIGEFLNEKST
ncbi:hypothetical protein Q1695_003440 [Nippostrongylus brasiliensis]|nr:hypothetical protein Q1695_003440 [Nippostrongylus brasiliensis]